MAPLLMKFHQPRKRYARSEETAHRAFGPRLASACRPPPSTQEDGGRLRAGPPSCSSRAGCPGCAGPSCWRSQPDPPGPNRAVGEDPGSCTPVSSHRTWIAARWSRGLPQMGSVRSSRSSAATPRSGAHGQACGPVELPMSGYTAPKERGTGRWGAPISDRSTCGCNTARVRSTNPQGRRNPKGSHWCPSLNTTSSRLRRSTSTHSACW